MNYEWVFYNKKLDRTIIVRSIQEFPNINIKVSSLSELLALGFKQINDNIDIKEESEYMQLYWDKKTIEYCVVKKMSSK